MLKVSSDISLNCCALCRADVTTDKNDSLNFPSLLYYLMSQLAQIWLFVINKQEMIGRRNER